MVVAAGVETQEYTYLSLDERKSLIRRTIELVDGRVPVMVGVSHPSFKTAIELAQLAERLGAAAVQLLAPLRPFAGPPTGTTSSPISRRWRGRPRCRSRSISIPARAPTSPFPTRSRWRKLPRVQFIKESSRDLARVSRLIVEIDRAGHARYFTTMQMLLITLHAGRLGRHHAAAGRGDRTAHHRRVTLPRTTSAPPSCSSSSRCSRPSGCIAGSPRR